MYLMKICSIDGCNLKHVAKGYCRKHWRRFKLHGNPHYTENIRDHAEICIVDGCNEKFVSKGYCNKHYRKFLKHGDPLRSEIKRIPERHGMTKTSEYIIWAGIKQRCHNPKNKDYYKYGEKGITVCDRWLNSFVNFLDDMGKRPFPDAQIDRKKNHLGYSPNNCRWVTIEDNNRNKTDTKLSMKKAREIRELSHKMKVGELAKMYNVNHGIISNILANKTWKEQEILPIPPID